MPVSLASSSAAVQSGAIVPIAHQKVYNNSTYAFVFTNIPQTYQDLMIVTNHNNSGGFTDYGWFVNFNDSSLLYSYTTLRGNGSAVSSFRGSSAGDIFAGVTNNAISPNLYANAVFDVFNYTSNTMFKTVLNRASNNNLGLSAGYVDYSVGLWRSLSPVTGIALHIGGANMFAGSTATLYGVRRAGQ